MYRALVTLITIATCAGSYADVTLIMKDVSNSDEFASSQSSMKVKDGVMLLTEDEDNETTTLFREADQAIIHIDHMSKTYVVMDKKSSDAVSEQMSAQMAMLQEQLKSMPPEQREMLMKRMPQIANLGKNKTPPSFDVKRLGKSEDVAGISCEVVELSEGKKPAGTACIATAKQLGMSKDDYSTIKAMMTRMQAFAAQFGENVMPSFEAVGGFPIKYSGGMGKMENAGELVSVSTSSLDSSLFAIPDGYSRRSMGDDY